MQGQTYTLTAKKYRGQTFTRELQRLNVVTGPNGAGKTTLRLLIQEALSNQTEDGKTARELFEQYGDGETGYRLIFAKGDGSLEVCRKVDLNRKGSVACKVSVNGAEMSDKAAVGLLAAETMDPDDFYIGNFVNLSEEKQKNLLLSLLSRNEDIEGKRKVMLGEIENKAIQEAMKKIEAKSWIDYLLATQEAAKQEKTSLQSEKMRLKKTTETAVEFRSEKTPKNYQSLIAEKETQNKEKHEIDKVIAKEDGKREAFRKHQASIDDSKKKSQAYEKALKEIEQALAKGEDFTKKIASLNNQKTKLQIRLESLQAVLLAFEDDKTCPFAAEAGVECPVDISAKLQEMEAEADEKQAEVIKLVKEIKAAEDGARKQKNQEKEVEQLKARIEEVKESRLAAEKALDDLDMGQDTASQKMQLENIDKRLKEITDNLSEAKEAENAVRMIEEARQRLELVEIEQESAKKDIETIAVEIQNHLRTVIAPLEDSINALLSQIRPAYRLRFFDDEGNYKPRCRNRKGNWASLKAISGGEKASYYPALLKAMYELKQPKFSVLLCENSEIDGDNMINFLQGIQRNATGIDLVLVNSWFDNFTPPDGWNHIKLEINEEKQDSQAKEDPDHDEEPEEDAGDNQPEDTEATAAMF